MGDIMCCEFRHDLEEYLAYSSAKIKTLEEIIKFYEANPEKMMKYGITGLRNAMEEAAGKLDDPVYLEALAERERLRTEVIESLKGYDACVMTGATNIMHFVGLPSVALKLCMADDNTPRGIILYGADERKLFSAALAIESFCLEIPHPIL
jgi:Asp-tRNA(Asn)/Glu-tRNA(Gln) amidotransferase A subunit family amidase